MARPASLDPEIAKSSFAGEEACEGLSFLNEDRRAEYNRPTASPRWVRMCRQYPVPDRLAAFALRRNETRSLS